MLHRRLYAATFRVGGGAERRVVQVIEEQEQDDAHYQWITAFMRKKNTAIPGSLRVYCGINSPERLIGKALAEELHLYTKQNEIAAFFLKLAFTARLNFKKTVVPTRIRKQSQNSKIPDFKTLFQAATYYVNTRAGRYSLIFGAKSKVLRTSVRNGGTAPVSCTHIFDVFLEWMTTHDDQYDHITEVFAHKKNTRGLRILQRTIGCFLWCKLYSYSMTSLNVFGGNGVVVDIFEPNIHMTMVPNIVA